MNIIVIGTGYVGLVTGACFAEMGNIVTCIDIDKSKIDNLNQGILPIYEPGLKDLLLNNIKADRLFFSTSLKDSIGKSNIFFIAVGTPEGPTGEANMEYIYNVAHELGNNLYKKSIIVNKSTVPIGTAEKTKSIIQDELCKRNIEFPVHVVSNPEFLKEGSAIQDFMRPDYLLDISSDEAYQIMAYDLKHTDGEYFIQSHSTNPLLKSETIKMAIESYFLNIDKYDSLFSVTPIQTRIYNNNYQAINHDPAKLIKTQNLPVFYEENSCIYIFNRKSFLDNKNRIGKNPNLYPIDKFESVDIDEEFEFLFAESLMKQMQEF